MSAIFKQKEQNSSNRSLYKLYTTCTLPWKLFSIEFCMQCIHVLTSTNCMSFSVATWKRRVMACSFLNWQSRVESRRCRSTVGWVEAERKMEINYNRSEYKI